MLQSQVATRPVAPTAKQLAPNFATGQARRVEEAVAAIRARWQGLPRAAVVLGTGLGDLAEKIDAEAAIPYAEIPHFPRSTALAHVGRLVCGRLRGVPIVAMQGRCHLYEGYRLEQITLPIEVMAALGAEMLIASNASGGVNPRFQAGDVMVLEDHINLMNAGCFSPPHGQASRGQASRAHSSLGNVSRRGAQPPVYDRELIDDALAVARRENFVAHQGVYVAVSGPNYETRAEYRLFRRLGGDAVGMSTVPEALAGRRCGQRVMALSIITNVARPDAPQEVDAEDVVAAARASEPRVERIVSEIVAGLAKQG